jgi:hypothetical protein
MSTRLNSLLGPVVVLPAASAASGPTASAPADGVGTDRFEVLG